VKAVSPLPLELKRARMESNRIENEQKGYPFLAKSTASW
jgi:hypothetical protein